MSIELKLGYPDSTIQDLLDKPGTALQEYEKWLDQAEESARNSGTPFWLIIVQRTRRKALVILSESLMNVLDHHDMPDPIPMCVMAIPRTGKTRRTTHLVVMQLESFLRFVSRARIEEVYTTHFTEAVAGLSA